MTYGIRCKDKDTGEVTYDSTMESTLFWVADEYILGTNVGTGAGIFYQYPAYAGKKLIANLASPYGNGELQGWAVLSCRVTYPGGVPTINIFVDNATAGLPICNGYLLVFFTGASQ